MVKWNTHAYYYLRLVFAKHGNFIFVIVLNFFCKYNTRNRNSVPEYLKYFNLIKNS